MMEHPNDGYFMRNQGTVVICKMNTYLTKEFKFPAIIDRGFSSNISHQIMIYIINSSSF